MDRIGIYTRLSSDPTGQQTATARQGFACRQLCTLRGWEIAEVFEDVDLSAFHPKVVRPGFERMLQQLVDRRLDGVVVWKLDRLVRRPSEFERFWEICEDAGAFVASVTEPIDSSTDLGLALVRILVTFAHLESATISLRQRDRNAHAARLGRAPSRPRPYGLNTNWTKVVVSEAAVIREIAMRLLAGESKARVAAELNRRKIPAPSGALWSVQAVSRLVKSPRIVGDRVYRGEVVATNCFPAILSRDDFNRLQAQMTRRQPTIQHHLLTTLLVCGRCGNRMFVGNRKGDVGYRCGTQLGCGRVAVARVPVDTLVVRRLLRRAAKAGHDEAARRASDTASVAHAHTEMVLALRLLRTRKVSYDEYLRRRRAADREAASALNLPWGQALTYRWPHLDLEDQFRIMCREVERITIFPAKRQGKNFDGSRVRITWAGTTSPESTPTALHLALRAARAKRYHHAQRWLSIDETRHEVGGVSRRRLIQLVLDNEIPAYRDGKALVFRLHEVNDYVAAAQIIPSHSSSRGVTSPKAPTLTAGSRDR